MPLKSEYKPPTVLLSRKGPKVQSRSSRPPTTGVQDLSLSNGNPSSGAGQESSEDEEEVQARELTLAERQAKAAKERGEKQRRYEERRKELFGASNTGTTFPAQQQGTQNKSGASTPASLTPPGSRSATPCRGRGGRGGRRGGAVGDHGTISRNQSRGGAQQRELYDTSYAPKPESAFIQRRERENGPTIPSNVSNIPPIQQPIRAPRGPDGSGRGGFGFTRATVPGQAERDTLRPTAKAAATLNATASPFIVEAMPTTS